MASLRNLINNKAKTRVLISVSSTCNDVLPGTLMQPFSAELVQILVCCLLHVLVLCVQCFSNSDFWWKRFERYFARPNTQKLITARNEVCEANVFTVRETPTVR